MAAAAGDASADGFEEHVRRECGFTRYPVLCVNTLMESGQGDHADNTIISILVNKTVSEAELSTSFLRGLLGRPEHESLAQDDAALERAKSISGTRPLITRRRIVTREFVLILISVFLPHLFLGFSSGESNFDRCFLYVFSGFIEKGATCNLIH